MASVFFVVGFKYWILVGGLVAIISFQPAIDPEFLKSNQALMSQYHSEWFWCMIKTTGLIALVGGIVGVAASKIFFSRPIHEHFTPVFKPSWTEPPPFIPAHFQGPKSLAEIFSTPLILFVAAIAGLGATYFIPPFFEGGLVVCSGGQRIAGIVIGTIQSVILSVLILPSSIKKIKKLINL